MKKLMMTLIISLLVLGLMGIPAFAGNEVDDNSDQNTVGNDGNWLSFNNLTYTDDYRLNLSEDYDYDYSCVMDIAVATETDLNAVVAYGGMVFTEERCYSRKDVIKDSSFRETHGIFTVQLSSGTGNILQNGVTIEVANPIHGGSAPCNMLME